MIQQQNPDDPLRRLPARRRRSDPPPRRNRDRLQPGAGRRRDDARDRGRDLPGLQRERRACRGCRPTGSTAEVPSAANLVRGNEARIGGLRVGRDRQDHAGAARRTAPTSRSSTSSSRPGSGRCRWTPRSSSGPRSALGLKYVQITRGTSSAGLRGRRRGSRSPATRRSGRSTSTSSTACSTSRRVTRPRRTWPATAPPSRAAARASTARSRRSCRWPSTRRRCSATSPNTSTRFDRFFKEQGDAAAHRGAGGGDPGARCSWPSTTTFTAFAECRGPLHPSRASPRARRASTPRPRCSRR